MHQHDGLVPGTRDSDRPMTGLYLFCGRGQPVGIAALLVAHAIQYAPASLPIERAMLAVPRKRWGSIRAGFSCPRALPIRSPKGTPARVLPGGSREQDRPPEP